MAQAPLLVLLLATAGAAASLTCEDPALSGLKFCDAALPVAERVADLLPRLNTTQQIAQMTGRAPAIPELGMVEYNYGGEALHGLWGTCVHDNATGATKCPTQFGSPLANLVIIHGAVAVI